MTMTELNDNIVYDVIRVPVLLHVVPSESRSSE